jgi:hypothetical protein
MAAVGAERAQDSFEFALENGVVGFPAGEAGGVTGLKLSRSSSADLWVSIGAPSHAWVWLI